MTEERAHAVLGPSSAKRWMSCTPSALLEKNMPAKTSPHAEEGTKAHEAAEITLGHFFKTGKRLEKAEVEDVMVDELSNEMWFHVGEYVDHCITIFNQRQPAVGYVELKVDYSEAIGVKGQFGTTDCAIIGNTDGVFQTLDVIDLKYGKGVPVEAKDNPQPRLYALGTLSNFELVYEFSYVNMTIFQPRLDSVTTDGMSVKDLRAWAKKEVMPKAKQALAGQGDQVPGDHCQFCKVKATCRARAEWAAKIDFAANNPLLLSQEEVAQYLGVAKQAKTWSNDILEYALHEAVQEGVVWPGWKLVEGRGSRVFSDTEAAADKLELFYDEDVFRPRELLSPAKLEKALGKKDLIATVGSLIIKKSGAPTLVPEDDKRPAMGSAELAQRDFAGEVED